MLSFCSTTSSPRKVSFSTKSLKSGHLKSSASTLTAAQDVALNQLHSTWPLSITPDQLKPYAELIRITKPAGVMMFYFPGLYGTFLVGALGHTVGLGAMLTANIKLLLLSFCLRGMLCTWNDTLDQDIDRQVERTAIRPLARRAISTPAALAWTVIQTIFCFAAFSLLPPACLTTAIPFLILHVFYPFSKRLTHHPQLVLGFAHSLGVCIAFPALGQSLTLTPFSDSISTATKTNTIAAASLSLAIIFWTLLNDTIYAAQDLEDDLKAGVGSTMIYWGSAVKHFLRALGIAQVLALAEVAVVIRDTAPLGGVAYSALTVGGTALGTLAMVEGVDLKSPKSCGWWFNTGNVLLGCGIGSGVVGEYMLGLVAQRVGCEDLGACARVLY